MAKFLIVEARFYSHLNDMLLDGVRSALPGFAGRSRRGGPAGLGRVRRHDAAV